MLFRQILTDIDRYNVLKKSPEVKSAFDQRVRYLDNAKSYLMLASCSVAAGLSGLGFGLGREGIRDLLRL